MLYSTVGLLLVAGGSALQVGVPMRTPSPLRVRMEVAEPAPATAPAPAAAPFVEWEANEGLVIPTGSTYSQAALKKAFAARPSLKQTFDGSKDLQDLISRAEFWTNETATILECINVIGRWEKASDFYARTKFTTAADREEDLRQAGTEKRHQMALKLKCTERIALAMNAPDLPFTNERLAASVGLTCADFEDIPVTEAACNVVYDALAESRSGLIPYADCDQRRSEWINPDGSLNKSRFMIGLAKSRLLVIIAWFVFGKGNFVWVLVAAQALHDIRPDLFPTPKELGLDKIGFFT